MHKPFPMARLLQGDVGSGKTMVALLAALYAVERGGQVAIMAPTELLARQHATIAAHLVEPLGVRLAFVTGSISSAVRPQLLEALKSGDIDIAIGTHALFSDDVSFKNLELIIIDEQQRFGVLQRIALYKKGHVPDFLMMTATPIPRSLALTFLVTWKYLRFGTYHLAASQSPPIWRTNPEEIPYTSLHAKNSKKANKPISYIRLSVNRIDLALEMRNRWQNTFPRRSFLSSRLEILHSSLERRCKDGCDVKVL